MREIKFRVWHPVEWDDDDKATKFEMCYDWAFEEYGTLNDQIASLSNIMQYTGIKDKNGKEIYEGDIVEVSGRKNGIVRDGERGLVEWRGCKFVCCSLPPDDWDSMSPCFNPMFAPLIVIGNRYENPELLTP